MQHIKFCIVSDQILHTYHRLASNKDSETMTKQQATIYNTAFSACEGKDLYTKKDY